MKTHKVCKRCLEVKPIKEFEVKLKDGTKRQSHHCKKCRKERVDEEHRLVGWNGGLDELYN